MDSSRLPKPETDNRTEGFAALLDSRREQAMEYVDALQGRLERAADAIEHYLRRLEEDNSALPKEPVQGGPEEDFRRRYEMALDDLRDLKAKHAELERELAQARSHSANHAGAGTIAKGTLDWEAEKRRILSALETDFDAHDPQQRTERLKIEQVLQTTAKALAEKDRELEMLRKSTAESGGRSDKMEQAADVELAADRDPLVREERRRLAELQEQLREKLRQAEIELSVERAKLARWRAELEDRAKIHPPETTANNPAENPDPPSRGRWLARLGLTEADRERRKRR